MTETNGAKARASLYAKLARVMGEIGELEKKGRNDNFNYAFIRDVDVANALRPLLAEEGVAMLVGMDNIEQQRVTSGSGNEGLHTLASMSVTFADGETGATVTVPWYGEAIDYQDKGVNKCATAGLKFALLKTFLIGSEDDPGAHSPQVQSRGTGSRSGSAGASMQEVRGTVLNFGKFKGETLGHVADVEPDYLEWLADNWNWDKGRGMAQALLASLDAAAQSGGNGSGGNGGTPPTPRSNGGATSTDFWRTAKQMKNAGDLDDDEINSIKIAHQGPDGIDWDGAIEGLKEARMQKIDEELPF
jgi:hypothetical protein